MGTNKVSTHIATNLITDLIESHANTCWNIEGPGL